MAGSEQATTAVFVRNVPLEATEHDLVQVPLVLGRGSRVWDGLEGLEQTYAVEAVSSPSGVTHLTFTRRAAAA